MPCRLRRPEKSKRASLLRNEKFGADGAGECGVLVAGVGDQHADGGIAAGEELGLANNANHRPAQDAGDGFDPGDRWDGLVAVFETITHPLPNQVFECDGLCGRDALLPAAIALGDFDRPFRAAEDVVLGIDDLGDELAGTRARPMVGDGDREDATTEVAAADGAPASVNGA